MSSVEEPPSISEAGSPSGRLVAAGAALLLALSSLILFHNLGASSLMGDESTFAQVAREAADQGHWWPLTFHGAPDVSKPPLKFWATAAIFRVFGFSEWNDRVLDASFGVATIFLVYLFGCAFFGFRAGICAGLLLLSAHYLVFRHGFRSGVTDSLLVFLFTCALLISLRVRGREPVNRDLGGAIVCGILTGLCLFTKNAVGWLVPAIVAAFEAMRVAYRRPRVPFFETFRKRVAPIVLIALAFQAAWILAVSSATGGRAAAFFHRDVWERFRTGIDPAHLNPGLYRYVLRFDFGKGLLILPAAFYFAWRDFRRGEALRAERILFLSLWAATVLGVMELSVSKLSWYIYPAYPALALLLAFGIDRIAREAGRLSRPASAGVLSIVLLFIGMHLWRAWRTAEREEGKTDAARLAAWFSPPGSPALCREPGLKMREWEEFYLWPIARQPAAGNARCEMILTRTPSLYISPTLVPARAHRFKNYATLDPPLFVVRPEKDLPPELFAEARHSRPASSRPIR